MSCPFQSDHNHNTDNGLKPGQVSYDDYLKISEIIKYQIPLSEKIGNNLVHDEYLFITIHQTYELWFKLIIIEIDSVRELLSQPILDEGNNLLIVSRLGRIVKIQKILVEQLGILETMTSHDFDKFRRYLSPASGFQSWQFRLIENKLGIPKERRIRHNNTDYSEAEGFSSKARESIKISEREPNLLGLIDSWLCRTPGLEPDGFDFTGKLRDAVDMWLKDLEANANDEESVETKEVLMSEIESKRENFNNLFDEEKQNKLKIKGDRRLSFKAFQGALFIFFFRDEPRFNQPYQIISLLVDIDSLFIKWRYNHAILVQRMIGGRLGTGGSSGYQYLLATASDRYKVFLDLFNLSSYIIPQTFMPKLDSSMKKRLSVFKLQVTSDGAEENSNNDETVN
ncbi:tryptophan 2,3-dioxygenase-like [Dendronephthya gigantea]|uniref:tryptophan 2,3-dioxygenase-like n=1 Tax=Dendronephthya gigantea TaxID=151771 RepID=UPI00106A0AE8|nr:tryptophan 2,3-dioxygenase-like [Dendronephthya gigantea]